MNQLDPDEPLTPDDWDEIRKWQGEYVSNYTSNVDHCKNGIRLRWWSFISTPAPYWRLLLWVTILIALIVLCELLERS